MTKEWHDDEGSEPATPDIQKAFWYTLALGLTMWLILLHMLGLF